MYYNSIMMLSIADGLGMFDAMFNYTWLIGWVGYVLMVWLAFSTLLDVIKIIRDNKEKKRMGEQ